MTTLAYSGISNPFKVLTAGGENEALENLSASVSKTYTLTITQNGYIQAFLADLLTLGGSGPGTAGSVRISLKRNGFLLHSFAELYNTFNALGNKYQENLSFLAGAEVSAGEVFTMTVTLQDTNPANQQILNYNVSISMTVTSVDRKFSV